jgi:hypothetical protein
MIIGGYRSFDNLVLFAQHHACEVSRKVTDRKLIYTLCPEAKVYIKCILFMPAISSTRMSKSGSEDCPARLLLIATPLDLISSMQRSSSSSCSGLSFFSMSCLP